MLALDAEGVGEGGDGILRRWLKDFSHEILESPITALDEFPNCTAGIPSITSRQDANRAFSQVFFPQISQYGRV